MTKKRILFILPSLRAGGAERVISFVSQNLNPEIYDATLIVLGFRKDAVYSVNSTKVIYLEQRRLIYAIPTLFRKILKVKPDIVVGSISHINIVLGAFKFLLRKIKFVGREASVLSSMQRFSRNNPRLMMLFMKIFYPRLDAVICQSKDMLDDFGRCFGIQENRLFLINNPITNSFQCDDEMVPSEQLMVVNFITVGRLSEEKGHKRIIYELGKVKYDFTYTIVGSGPLLNDLKQLCKEVGIDGNTIFIDHTSNVLKLISKHDYFVQGSYVEGFPNALLESCVAGTPVIAFNAPGGTREIVQEGVNGYLIDNEEHFHNIMQRIIKFKPFRRDLVRQSVLERFDSKKILRQYEELFTLIVK